MTGLQTSFRSSKEGGPAVKKDYKGAELKVRGANATISDRVMGTWVGNGRAGWSQPCTCQEGCCPWWSPNCGGMGARVIRAEAEVAVR